MNIRKLLAILLCAVLILCFAGCAAASDSYAEGGNSINVEAGLDRLPSDGSLVLEEPSSATGELPPSQKLIQKVWISAETEDMDSLLAKVNERISQLGGYMESQDIYNGSAYSGRRVRSASLVIRVPAEKLDSFVDQIGEVSNIVSTKKTSDDVTLSYVATESRMLALQTQETRLLELLAEAKNMEDLLTIEDKLTSVRTELEQVTSALKVYDSLINYSTIYLDIDEVRVLTEIEEEPETIWERISVGFVDSLNGVGEIFVELFVFLVVASPYLLTIAGITLVFALFVFLLVRFIIWICTRKKK